ncbi:MAG: CU044_2847 family protein [Microcystaceae cyanobacterium]
MTRLTPIQIDENTLIYIESSDDLEIPTETSRTEGRVAKGGGSAPDKQQILQNFQTIEATIRAYTTYTLNAFRNLAIANIEEVTLQFGVEIGGEAGIPYITKGTVKSNLNITVKCTFPNPPHSSD